MKLLWKEASAETMAKLFFSADMLAQVNVSPGLMWQTALLHYKVMQGEIGLRCRCAFAAPGEITRVQGNQMLAWNLESISNSPDRRLVIKLNQPRKDQFSFQVQAQTPRGAFPQSDNVLQISPENAAGFSGFLRVDNEGAVRLEVAQSGGASQISPDQFPES